MDKLLHRTMFTAGLLVYCKIYLLAYQVYVGPSYMM